MYVSALKEFSNLGTSATLQFSVRASVAYSDSHSLPVCREEGNVETSLQLFPVSSEKPPTPLECLVCALWSLILIIKLSLQHEPWVANSGAPGSSALNQSNQVLHWRTFFSFFNQVVLILPYHIFIIMLVPSLME